MPYVIESFNAQRFLELINTPTPKQLDILVNMFREAIEIERESYCSSGDPAYEWGTAEHPLERVLTERLTSPDWYAGLTNGGGAIWDMFMSLIIQSDELKLKNRLDCEGLSWEFLDEINRQLLAKTGKENASFLAFGHRPYRYLGAVPNLEEQQPHGDDLTGGLMKVMAFLEKCKRDPLRFQELLDADETLAPAQKKVVQKMFNDCLEEDEDDEASQSDDDLFGDDDDEDDDEHHEYEPAHSIHLPEEISQMLADLKSIEESITQDEELSEQYEELVEILERLLSKGRAMYVISDT